MTKAEQGVQLEAGSALLTAKAFGNARANLDAFLLRPGVVRLDLAGPTRQTLLQSFATGRRVVSLRTRSPSVAYVYDETGTLTETVQGSARRIRVPVESGSFSYVRARQP